MTTKYEIPAYLRRAPAAPETGESPVKRDKDFYLGYLDASVNILAANLKSTAMHWLAPVSMHRMLNERPDLALEYIDQATHELDQAQARLREIRELIANKLLKEDVS